MCQQNECGHANNGPSSREGSNIYPLTKQNHNNTLGEKSIGHSTDEAKECLLTYGPYFAVATQCPPNEEYIAAMEKVCQKLTQSEADKLWAEIKGFLKKAHPSKPNIDKQERRQ